MSIAQPFWLLLLLVLPVLIRRAGKRPHAAMHWSDAVPKSMGQTWRTRAVALLPGMRWIAIGLLILAMARPQRHWVEQKIQAEALDIVLSMDISLSMLSRDFDPDRLTVSKRVASAFVSNRPYDRIGLVAFSAEAFTQVPLTTDKQMLKVLINELKPGILEHGTAIGMGLATAVNRLRESSANSRIVILLTDGDNNAGYISPQQAAEMARAVGVRVYTIGIGTEGLVLTPEGQNPDGSFFFAPRYTRFDTKLLQEMARATGGTFFRAESAEDLAGVYQEIDRMEKTKIEYTENYKTNELFVWPAGLAIILILLELLLRFVFLRSITV